MKETIAFSLTKARNVQEGITRYIIELSKRNINFNLIGEAFLPYNTKKEDAYKYYKKYFELDNLILKKTPLPMRYLTNIIDDYKNHFLNINKFFGTKPVVRVYFYNFVSHFKQNNKVVLVIHDLTLLHDKTISEKERRRVRKQYLYSANKANLIFTDSNYSKQDIISTLGIDEKKVKVNYCGVNLEKYNINIAMDDKLRVIRKYNLPEKYILFVGQPRINKNLPNLLYAYSKLPNQIKKEYSLVLANSTKDLEKLSYKLDIHNNCRFLNGIDEEDIVIVYKLSSLLSLISFSEGFGLPLVEAMACGIPTITSNCSCMPEIVNNASLLINPYDVNDISKGLQMVLLDTDLRKKLINNGYERIKMFNWDNTARIFYKEIERLINE